jgi:tetratricopeptide (TPR) repeat protein/predicted Ser/Thr protein kinase
VVVKLDLATEERALRNAIKKGLLKEEVLKEIEAESVNLVPIAEDLSPRFELLLRRGLIDPATLQALIREAKEESVAADADLLDATLRVKYHDSPPEFIPRFGRYENLNLLGQGGMAIVYKAFDPTLGRHVALKFLRREDPQYLKRFLMEARLQARLNHENICRVYEVGQAEDKPYIAMQYIEGKTLKDVASKLTTLEKALIMKHVAEAVQEAHRAGLIHRDLKPVNILVERTEDGEWIPYVLDFGIARHMEGSDMTATGLILGTPWYMSPEQASGATLDHRTDVYSLGATMYELFSGNVPFEAVSAQEILLKILGQEPVPLQQRNSNIPFDLQTIVMKCMEKEPARRYQSAKAVAEELDRFVKGDPILARPTGIFSRTYRRARKNRALSVTVAVGVLLIGILLTIGLKARWKAQKQTEIAQRFGQQIAKIENGLRSAYLLPLHDVRSDKQKVRMEIKEIVQQMKQLGEPAEGPGYYAIGRGHLALGEYESAKENFENAMRSGLNTPDLAHALGLALGNIYRQQLQEAERIQNKEIRKSVIENIQKEFRDPALEYLKKGEAPEYLRALIAFYEKNWKEAERLAIHAARQDASLYEAKLLHANIYAAIGNDLGNMGKVQEAMDRYELGAKHFVNALEFARSDPGAHSDFCDLRLQQVSLLAYQEDASLDASMKNVVEACDRSLAADPEQSQIYTKKAEALWLQGRWMMENGNNPEPALSAARKDLAKAATLDPKDGNVYKTVGITYLVEGEYKLNGGQDPRQALQVAVENLNRAIHLTPNPLAATNSLGNAYWLLGRYDMDHGADPAPHLHAAMENYGKAIRMEPNFASAYSNLGIVYGSLATHKMSQGQDPIPDLQKSIENLEQSIRINPGTALTFNSLGNRFAERGDYQMSLGKDPSGSFQKSIASFDKARQLDAGWFSPVMNRGITYQSLADFELNHGRDPTDALQKAMKDYEEAIRLNPAYFGSYGNLALAYRTLGLFAAYAGKEPTKHYNLALQHVEKALKSNPEDLESLLIEARTYLDGAKYALSRGASPLSSLERAVSPLQKAEKLDPTVAEIHIYKSEIKLIAVRWRPVEEYFQQAFESLKKATELNPKSAEAQLIRAQYFRWHSDWLISKGMSVSAEVEQGIQACNQAIKLNPDLAEAYAVRSVLHAWQAKQHQDANKRDELFKLSKKDLSEAFRINKHLKIEYSTQSRKAV